MKNIINVDEIDDFNNHPFSVERNNLDELIESIKKWIISSISS